MKKVFIAVLMVLVLGIVFPNIRAASTITNVVDVQIAQNLFKSNTEIDGVHFTSGLFSNYYKIKFRGLNPSRLTDVHLCDISVPVKISGRSSVEIVKNYTIYESGIAAFSSMSLTRGYGYTALYAANYVNNDNTKKTNALSELIMNGVHIGFYGTYYDGYINASTVNERGIYTVLPNMNYVKFALYATAIWGAVDVSQWDIPWFGGHGRV